MTGSATEIGMSSVAESGPWLAQFAPPNQATFPAAPNLGGNPLRAGKILSVDPTGL